MISVANLLKVKTGSQVHSITSEHSTYEALQMMAEHNIGCIAVMDGDELKGLLTERDYARRIVLEGKKSRNTPVGETMNPDFHAIEADTPVEKCMEIMTRNRARYLPVMKKRKLVAILSIGDVVKALLQLQESNIDLLERMVTGQEYGS